VIEIDGSIGEGGGQVLRSALTLSLLTGQAFSMTRVRASRPRPGLFPQHLAAVQAAAQISAADVSGDRIGSRELGFAPGPVQPGRYHFDIGTAGATSLVLQTLLLPLALAKTTSSLSISGGTHVPWSPCFHYLDWHWRPLLARLGIAFRLELPMAGFYPQGGGELLAEIAGGARPLSLDLRERGGLRRLRGLSAVANLPMEIAERQRSQALRRLGRRITEPDVRIDIEPLPARSPGTLLLLLAEFEHSQACCFALGARGKRAERVADEAVDDLFAFLDGDGAVDRWMADQLLLPLALAAQASVFRTAQVSSHLLTNAAVIGAFLPVRIVVEGAPGEAALVHIQPGSAQ
jgi:RNA 3'-terminal phosphate cyclase (ATP)